MRNRGEVMKHYCTICRRIHEGRCKPVRRYSGVRNSEADKFRNSRVWKRKAAAILDRDYHCCRVCFSAGVVCSNDLSVHHIIPLAADFDKRLDDDNLITLCRYHHEQAERGSIPGARLRDLVQEGMVWNTPPTLT